MSHTTQIFKSLHARISRLEALHDFETDADYSEAEEKVEAYLVYVSRKFCRAGEHAMWAHQIKYFFETMSGADRAHICKEIFSMFQDEVNYVFDVKDHEVLDFNVVGDVMGAFQEFFFNMRMLDEFMDKVEKLMPHKMIHNSPSTFTEIIQAFRSSSMYKNHKTDVFHYLNKEKMMETIVNEFYSRAADEMYSTKGEINDIMATLNAFTSRYNVRTKRFDFN